MPRSGLTEDTANRVIQSGNAAQRLVRMGLEMQQKVKQIAKDSNANIGVRIGVHTGWVAGGNGRHA